MSGWLSVYEPATFGFNSETAFHVVGHGVVGGASNLAMGGKFQDGFISAAASAAAADAGAFRFIKGGNAAAIAGRTAVAGVVGGTASALGGGKFANGAWTAAFQHLLNKELGGKLKNANPGRGLTKGEKELLRENFGNSINVDSIKVFNYAFLPGMRISTPNGSIYAPGISYSADYSKEMIMGNTLAASQALFVHEATHAYQYQQGVQVKILRVTQPGKHANYSYHPFSQNKKYAEYGIEQQAMLVEDHFRVTHGALQVHDGNGGWHLAPSAASLKKVLPFNK